MAKKDELHPAIEFLRRLYANLPDGTVELRALPNDKSSQLRPVVKHTKAPGDVVAFAERFGKRGSQYGVYFGISKRSGKGGKKSDVLAAPAIWADIDCVVNGWDTVQTARMIMSGPFKPTACVMSGGGLHLYWFLTQPIAEIEAVERANKAARFVFGGDRVHDITRIFRLPGTWNTKRSKSVKVEVLWCEHWRTYDIDELTAAMEAHPTALDKGKWVKKEAALKADITVDGGDALAKYEGVLSHGRRGMSKNLDTLWRDRVRHNAPRGYIGIHEGKLLTTAWLHVGGYGEDNVDAVVRIVRRYVEQRIATDAPEARWDWEAEDEDTRKMFGTFCPKWTDLRKRLRDQAKAEKGKTHGRANKV